MRRLTLLLVITLLHPVLGPEETAVRPRIIALAFVRLHVSDLENSKQFYVKTFLLGNHHDDCLGPHCVCFRWNTLQKLELVQGDRIPGSGFLEEIGFSTYDLTAMRKYLVACGLQPGEIHKDWDGQERFEFRDFEGHHVAFVSPPLPG